MNQSVSLPFFKKGLSANPQNSFISDYHLKSVPFKEGRNLFKIEAIIMYRLQIHKKIITAFASILRNKITSFSVPVQQSGNLDIYVSSRCQHFSNIGNRFININEMFKDMGE